MTYDETYPSQWIADLAITYRLKNGLYATAGVNNILDSYPGQQNLKLSVGGLGMSKYSDLAPEGYDGTFYYGQLGYRF